MAKKFSELLDKMTPERRARINARAQEIIAALPLDQIRKAREMTQIELSERLDVAQGEVSKIEKRSDIHLSTLREYVEALGGKLVLRAEFPDGTVNVIDLAAK